MQLYDTLTRTLKSLQPEDGKTFRMYCCGPTVYGPSHIGNFRTFILQDVLRRTLEVAGYEVNHVRNITDIDDKTIAGAKEAGMPLKDFTQQWIDKFREDCAKLNLLEPHQEPKATDYIPQQVEMIQKLLDNGYAYQGGDGSIYFKVSSYDKYGRLSQLDKRELQTQAITSGGAANLADEYDRDHVADFALWKAEKEDDAEVDAVWDGPKVNGEPVRGRPGWHIECSAMIDAVFEGDLPIDLHGGAVDLIFPHHENEIAQSACAHGDPGNPLAKIWFHPAHLIVEGKKMSKSLGNLFTLDDVIAKGYSPMILRYSLISGHYRQPLNFTFNGLNAAGSALVKLEKTVEPILQKRKITPNEFESLYKDKMALNISSMFGMAWNHLTYDLNTPKCLGEIFAAIGKLDEEGLALELAGLSRVLYVLGLKLFTKDRSSVAAPNDVRKLAEERVAARKAGDWAKADKLRDQIHASGWQVKDSKDGYALEKL